MRCLDKRERSSPHLAIMGEAFASTDESQRNTYQEFKKIVGKKEAEAALNRYFREQCGT